MFRDHKDVPGVKVLPLPIARWMIGALTNEMPLPGRCNTCGDHMGQSSSMVCIVEMGGGLLVFEPEADARAAREDEGYLGHFGICWKCKMKLPGGVVGSFLDSDLPNQH